MPLTRFALLPLSTLQGRLRPRTLYPRPGAAPGALIGSQRPGARADQLMHSPAPRPLGEEPGGRRWGGGKRAGKERKRKGRGGGAGRRGGGERSREGGGRRAEGGGVSCCQAGKPSLAARPPARWPARCRPTDPSPGPRGSQQSALDLCPAVFTGNSFTRRAPWGNAEPGKPNLAFCCEGASEPRFQRAGVSLRGSAGRGTRGNLGRAWASVGAARAWGRVRVPKAWKSRPLRLCWL